MLMIAMTQSNSIKLTAARATRSGATGFEADDLPHKQPANGRSRYPITMPSWTEDVGIRHALARGPGEITISSPVW